MNQINCDNLPNSGSNFSPDSDADFDQDLVMLETSFANKDQAKKISEIILQKKLAACVEFLQIESSYFWQGKLCFETETLLRIKTAKSLILALKDQILQQHPYDLPQIIFYEISAEKNYANWVKKSLSDA